MSGKMNLAGGAKEMFYRFFQSKEKVTYTLSKQMFFVDNPFEAVRERTDLNALQRIRSLLTRNQADTKRNQIAAQTIPTILLSPLGGILADQANKRNIMVTLDALTGAAESALAVATILGSIAAGIFTKKWNIPALSNLLASLGGFIILSGIAFLLPVSAVIKYAVILVSFCGMQTIISIFSIFAVSLIQQRTPTYFIGKAMAYTSTITLCVQPLGEIVYGFLFDRFYSAVYVVLISTGIIVCMIGLSTKNLKSGFQESSESS